MAGTNASSSKKLKSSFKESHKEKKLLKRHVVVEEEGREEEEPEFMHLIEIVQLIISKLSIPDKASAALVCKKWRKIVLSVRIFNMPPSLIRLRSRNLYLDECCDLGYCSTYNICFPEVPARPRGEAYYAMDGWMLIFDNRTLETTLFCPQTRESVKLPEPQDSFLGAAFSTPPTSSDCVVFTMLTHPQDGTVEIKTCRPQNATWTTNTYESNLKFESFSWSCVVVYNGKFFCMDHAGRIGMYSPKESSWHVYEVGVGLKFIKHFSLRDWKYRVFLAKHKGRFYMVHTCRVAWPVVYKLSGTMRQWMKEKDLRGATFFAGFTSSFIRDGLPGLMSDCIYFPMLVSNGMHCLMYSLKHKRYNYEIYNSKMERFNAAELSQDGTIWVDYQPENNILGRYILNRVSQNRIRTYYAIRNAFERPSPPPTPLMWS